MLHHLRITWDNEGDWWPPKELYYFLGDAVLEDFALLDFAIPRLTEQYGFGIIEIELVKDE